MTLTKNITRPCQPIKNTCIVICPGLVFWVLGTPNFSELGPLSVLHFCPIYHISSFIKQSLLTVSTYLPSM